MLRQEKASAKKRESEFVQKPAKDEQMRQHLLSKLRAIDEKRQKGSSWDVRDTLRARELSKVTGDKGKELMFKYNKVFPLIEEYWRRDRNVLWMLDLNPLELSAKKYVKRLIKQLKGGTANEDAGRAPKRTRPL